MQGAEGRIVDVSPRPRLAGARRGDRAAQVNPQKWWAAKGRRLTHGRGYRRGSRHRDYQDKYAYAFVYFLRDPLTRLVRYVGMAHDVGKRVQAHRASRTPCGLWLRQLHNAGLRPIIECPVGRVYVLDAAAVEERLIAMHAVAYGPILLNSQRVVASFFGRQSPILEIFKNQGLTRLPTSVI